LIAVEILIAKFHQ